MELKVVVVVVVGMKGDTCGSCSGRTWREKERTDCICYLLEVHLEIGMNR